MVTKELVMVPLEEYYQQLSLTINQGESMTVGVVIGCMDCRLHTPDANAYEQFKQALGVEKVYVRTVAGPEGKILARGDGFRDIVADVNLIVKAKGATVAGVCGHHDCAGHPVSDDQHAEDAVRAAELLKEHLEGDVRVVALVATRDLNDNTEAWLVVEPSATSEARMQYVS